MYDTFAIITFSEAILFLLLALHVSYDSITITARIIHNDFELNLSPTHQYKNIGGR